MKIYVVTIVIEYDDSYYHNLLAELSHAFTKEEYAKKWSDEQTSRKDKDTMLKEALKGFYEKNCTFKEISEIDFTEMDLD